MKESEQVYWIKAVASVVTGGLCMYLDTYAGVHDTVAVMIGVAVYFAVSELTSIITKIDRDRTMRIGVGVFLFLWIFSWTLLNTLVKVF